MTTSLHRRVNPTCPRVGLRVKCIKADASLYGKIGVVTATLVNGHSFYVDFPLQQGGKIIARMERNELEVVEDDAVQLENIYHRYARIRVASLMEALQIIMVSPSVGDAITTIARQISKTAPSAFPPDDVDNFLRVNGLPKG